MKRIFQLALVLLLAVAFMLPTAAIINADGSDPDWDGVEGIVPAMNDIVLYDYDAHTPANDDYLGYIEVDETYEVPERNPLARDEGYADIEPIYAVTTEGITMVNNVLITWVALGLAALALLLAIIALAKAGHKKTARIKNDFF
ncbi:MAG: hypothetical protein FWE40_07560 [Oscillospiraceae bacterium]|jgi:hypothetical protein|nr:hypothetical protein [Oscillospiraceae bacterium]